MLSIQENKTRCFLRDNMHPIHYTWTIGKTGGRAMRDTDYNMKKLQR